MKLVGLAVERVPLYYPGDSASYVYERSDGTRDLVGAMLIAVPCVVGVNPAIRFLHPLAFGAVVALAVLVDGIRRRRRRLIATSCGSGP